MLFGFGGKKMLTDNLCMGCMRELGEEKVNELKQKMAGISAFCDMYENTNWRYYVGLQ